MPNMPKCPGTVKVEVGSTDYLKLKLMQEKLEKELLPKDVTELDAILFDDLVTADDTYFYIASADTAKKIATSEFISKNSVATKIVDVLPVEALPNTRYLLKDVKDKNNLVEYVYSDSAERWVKLSTRGAAFISGTVINKAALEAAAVMYSPGERVMLTGADEAGKVFERLSEPSEEGSYWKYIITMVTVPDWNENNSEVGSYIKNRTHYKNEIFSEIISAGKLNLPAHISAEDFSALTLEKWGRLIETEWSFAELGDKYIFEHLPYLIEYYTETGLCTFKALNQFGEYAITSLFNGQLAEVSFYFPLDDRYISENIARSAELLEEQVRAENAENSLDIKISNEATRAENKEAELLDSIESTQSNIQEAQQEISAIQDVISPNASADNKLTDKNFVNSSISTNTAHYISNDGEPFTSVEQLHQYTGDITNNDYAFVMGNDFGNTYFDRYKATVNGIIPTTEYKRISKEAGIFMSSLPNSIGEQFRIYEYDLKITEPINTIFYFYVWNYDYQIPTIKVCTLIDEGSIEMQTYGKYRLEAIITWAKEYRLNNSSFTAEQWAAISSGITASKVAQIDNKVEKTAQHLKIYGTDASGQPQLYSQSSATANAYSVPLRNKNGQIVAADPTADDQCVTKGYYNYHRRGKKRSIVNDELFARIPTVEGVSPLISESDMDTLYEMGDLIAFYSPNSNTVKVCIIDSVITRPDGTRYMSIRGLFCGTKS